MPPGLTPGLTVAGVAEALGSGLVAAVTSSGFLGLLCFLGSSLSPVSLGSVTGDK